jgi:hypothetical protein
MALDLLAGNTNNRQFPVINGLEDKPKRKR